MKIRKSSIAAAVATLAAGSMLAVSTPAIANTPTLLVWVDSNRVATFKPSVDAWAKANGVTVTLTGKDFGTVRDAMKTAVPAGTGPDLLIGAAHDWTGSLVSAGVVKSLTIPTARRSSLSTQEALVFHSPASSTECRSTPRTLP
jgi:maltose-binding protein MalE